MINDLKIQDVSSWKFVDDTTISEVVQIETNSQVQDAVTSVENWSTENKLQLNAEKCKELIIDFKQVFTILGEYYGQVLPLSIVLMTNRAIGHYRQVLQVLQRKIRGATGSEWEPEAIVWDFEQALITAIQTELPNTRIEGCYFHFNQSLWRHVKELGLTRAYRNHERVKKLIRKVMSIGFLPTAIVRNNFALLRTENRTLRFRRYPTPQKNVCACVGTKKMARNLNAKL
jgi:hypothetical protein